MTPLILIVDDHAANRQTLSELLDGQGYLLMEAPDGQTALQLAAATPPDLVLLDVMMPDMDGFEVCRRLRADSHLAEVPIILITSLDDQTSRLRGAEAGADDFITKPYNRAELRARVHTITRLNRYRHLLEMQAQLRESEIRFGKLAEHSDEVFWFHTVNPVRITYISPAVEKTWGCPPASFYEDPGVWTKGIHASDRARVQAAYDAMLAGDLARFEEEYRVVKPDGEVRWVLVSGTPICDDDKKIVSLGGVARDITDRKHAAEQILRAQRLESLGMLAAGIAHDFNNALAPVIMVGPLLRENSTDPGEQVLFDSMIKGARHGAALVKQLLAFTRGVSEENRLMKSEEVLSELVELTKSTFPKTITVASHVADDLKPIFANPTQLHQILLNLCVNARDAMPSGGNLTITAVNFSLGEAAAAEIENARPGDFVRIDVSDTGTGIPPEVVSRIWFPFFSTKGEGKGTGLGLSTVRGIVESFNGFALLETASGQGTRFSIYLPVGKEPTSLFSS